MGLLCMSILSSHLHLYNIAHGILDSSSFTRSFLKHYSLNHIAAYFNHFLLSSSFSTGVFLLTFHPRVGLQQYQDGEGTSKALWKEGYEDINAGARRSWKDKYPDIYVLFCSVVCVRERERGERKGSIRGEGERESEKTEKGKQWRGGRETRKMGG